MREILFRGGSSVDWEYGYYVKTEDGDFIVDTEYGGYVRIVEVGNETVGSYIGSCDKTGRRIFEGDICEGVYEDYTESRKARVKGVIEYCPETMSFFLNDNKEMPPLIKSESWLTVLGNIHDNPELLNEEK